MAKEPVWKNCKNCGRRFPAKKKNQRYCSDDCRAEYYKEHYFVIQEVEKVCPNCGEIFITTMPKKQTYCKPECREDARKKKVEGVVARYNAERATYLGERYATFERDGFKCTVCGRGAIDGAKLDVEEYEGRLKTICANCKAGKKFLSKK